MSPLSTLEDVNIMQDVPLQDRYVSVQVVLYLETVSLYWESHYVLTLSLTVITKETRIFQGKRPNKLALCPAGFHRGKQYGRGFIKLQRVQW